MAPSWAVPGLFERNPKILCNPLCALTCETVKNTFILFTLHCFLFSQDLKEPAEFYFWPQSELDDSEECTNDDDHIGPDDHDDYVKRHSSREDQDKAMQQREEKFSFTADEVSYLLSLLFYTLVNYVLVLYISETEQEYSLLLSVP